MNHPDTPSVFLFDSELSFRQLLAFWESKLSSASSAERIMAGVVLDQIPEDHILRSAVVTPEEASEHAQLVDMLMSAIVPIANAEDDIAAAMVPFRMIPVYHTIPFEKLNFLDKEKITFTTTSGSVAFAEMGSRKSLTVYHMVLTQYYGAKISTMYAYILESVEENTGLHQFHRTEFDSRFMQLEADGQQPVLTEGEVQTLLDDPLNLELFKATIPPEHFKIRGFSVVRASEVTESEVLSRLKQDLMAKNALVCPKNLDLLRQRLRSLVRIPELEFGIVALDRCLNGEVTGARSIGRSLVLSRGMPQCTDPDQTIFAEVYESGLPVLSNDLSVREGNTAFEMEVLEQGLKNYYLAPLLNDEIPMGFFEVGVPQASSISVLNKNFLDNVALLFSTALKRSLDEQEDRVQAMIKKRFTAVHPVVEWKFRQAALASMTPNKVDLTSAVSFDSVHSFFASSDIRGSSLKRGIAIQQDIAEQLGMALAIIISASSVRPTPSLDELGFRIEQNIEKVLSSVSSGDEVTYVDFLSHEIEPHFEELKSYSSDVALQVERYKEALDPELGIIYRKRKDFDDSVQLLNQAITQFINQKQEEAQKIAPHYFEMYRTDGVEFSMYAGSSLLKNGNFKELDLSSLRLWQLITMVGIASVSRSLRPELPVPLETAQLVLLQATPVDIHFRIDEKKFDIKGSYNVRYEIVKKRIDKAVILGTGERLTQPGKVAIVYTYPSELKEYQRYLNYMFAAGYFEGTIEYLELDALPGANGLKAMRATIAETQPGSTSYPIPEPGTISESKAEA